MAGASRLRPWRGTAWALGLLIGLAGVGWPGSAAAGPASVEQDDGYVPSFEVTGAVARPRRYTLADLERLPAIDVIHQCVVDSTHTMQVHAYRGVLLWSLLTEAGLALPAGPSPASLRSYVVATDPGGWEAMVVLAEIDPLYNRREVIVAYQRDGQLLDASLGMAQLVVPTDFTCERDAYHVARLEVRHSDSPPRPGR